MRGADLSFRAGAPPGVAAAIALGVFFLVPFAIMLAFSFYHKVPGGLHEPAFEADNYVRFFSPFFGRILLTTTWICALASVLALCVGFPLTYAVARMGRRAQAAGLILVVSLLSLSEVVIGFAWSVILSRTAGIGKWLALAGWIDAPRAFAPGFGALLLALVFICVPFVVLVLYPPLTRLPREWVEAARTLGATPLSAVATVVVPLMRGAFVSAFVLTFIYSLGSYVLPTMLGQPRHWTLSVHITDQALYQSNMPFAAAMSVFLVVTSLALIAAVGRVSKAGGRRP